MIFLLKIIRKKVRYFTKNLTFLKKKIGGGKLFCRKCLKKINSEKFFCGDRNFFNYLHFI